MLPSPAAYDVQKQRKHDAHENRSGEREIKCRVLAAIDDVAGKPANRQMCAPEKNEHDPDNQEQQSKENQKLAEVRHAFASRVDPFPVYQSSTRAFMSHVWRLAKFFLCNSNAVRALLCKVLDSWISKVYAVGHA
jgi:hypothetical protein